jgi:N-acetylglucosamine-6-phosphate deacetylase
VALLVRLLDAGPVTMITLAPELPGALPLVDLLAARGVVVSLGHTGADAAAANVAFARGARAVTHVLNAMAPIRARAPGPAGAALVRDDVAVFCIADGVHLAPETLRLLVATAGRRLVLTSDAINAGGDGTAQLAGMRVEVRGGRATLPDGTLAGSVGTVADGVRRLTRLGVAIDRAVATATSTPAAVLGRDDVGVLRVGGRADVVVLDDRLEVVAVLVEGRDVR